MCVSEESTNDKDVAAAPHRVSLLLKPSRTLMTVVLLHYKRCAARKRATATNTHLTSAQYVCACCLGYKRKGKTEVAKEKEEPFSDED